MPNDRAARFAARKKQKVKDDNKLPEGFKKRRGIAISPGRQRREGIRETTPKEEDAIGKTIAESYEEDRREPQFESAQRLRRPEPQFESAQRLRHPEPQFEPAEKLTLREARAIINKLRESDPRDYESVIPIDRSPLQRSEEDFSDRTGVIDQINPESPFPPTREGVRGFEQHMQDFESNQERRRLARQEVLRRELMETGRKGAIEGHYQTRLERETGSATEPAYMSNTEAGRRQLRAIRTESEDVTRSRGILSPEEENIKQMGVQEAEEDIALREAEQAHRAARAAAFRKQREEKVSEQESTIARMGGLGGPRAFVALTPRESEDQPELPGDVYEGGLITDAELRRKYRAGR